MMPTATGAKHSFLGHALMLGSLTAVVPLATDMYLPAFPAIARDFATDEGAIQRSLITWFVGMAAGQLLYGPVSDRFGRRAPLMVGFVLFIAASIGCALARGPDSLMALRVAQAVGGCAGTVIAMAIVRDLYSGIAAARMFSAIVLVLGVAPIVAPLLGAVLLGFFAWPSIFWFMAGFGAFCLAIVVFALSETHPPERRAGTRIGRAFASYGALLTDRRFVGVVASVALAQSAFFAYLAGSSFVFITLHGFSPTGYSLIFAVNSIALIATAQTNVWMIRRIGTANLVRMAIFVQAIASLLLLGANLAHIDTPAVIAALLFVGVGSMGVIFPVGTALALDPYGKTAGAASALLGAVQFAGGAISSTLVSVLFDGSARPMVMVIAACSAGAALIGWRTLRANT